MTGAANERDVGPRPKRSSDITPGHLFAIARHLMPFEKLIELIAEYFNVAPNDIVQAGIKPKGPKADARQVGCFFAYRLWALPEDSPGSFDWIAKRLRYSDKSGAHRAYTRIEQRAHVEPELREAIETIEQRLVDYLRSRIGGKA